MILAIIISLLVITFFILRRQRGVQRTNKSGGDLEPPKEDKGYKPDDKEKDVDERENPPQPREPQIK